MDFFPDVEVSAWQAEAMARGLYAVAVVDGVHERELALITDFHRGTINDGAEGASSGAAASLASISPLGPEELAAALPAGDLRKLFIKAAFLLAWADGSVSAAERGQIGQFARTLGISPEDETRLEAEVKDYLLRPLARLANVDAVSAIAKKIGA